MGPMTSEPAVPGTRQQGPAILPFCQFCLALLPLALEALTKSGTEPTWSLRMVKAVP